MQINKHSQFSSILYDAKSRRHTGKLTVVTNLQMSIDVKSVECGRLSAYYYSTSLLRFYRASEH